MNNLTAPNNNLSLNSHKITDLATPTLSTDAVTKDYVDLNSISETAADAKYYLNTTTLNNITLASGDIDVNSHKITNLATPTNNSDAATKQYVDSNSAFTQAVADTLYYSNTVTLNNITAPNNNLSLNSHKITNLADPVSN